MKICILAEGDITTTRRIRASRSALQIPHSLSLFHLSPAHILFISLFLYVGTQKMTVFISELAYGLLRDIQGETLQLDSQPIVEK